MPRTSAALICTVLLCAALLGKASQIEVGKDGDLHTQLLCNKSCDGNHSQTTVIQLLGLQLVLLSRVLYIK